ncbi:hypothetical protein AAFF_G00004770 [Aldrovandia affinis]|uniref:Uncharacterized protein n=1 Tax=Aldrovandia affinis TaxID=143900 RepID=A0AAD7X3T8_9TELE|nr:hypothetical protein AAFF_G00004770 [Aldrovandia affinis]
MRTKGKREGQKRKLEAPKKQHRDPAAAVKTQNPLARASSPGVSAAVENAALVTRAERLQVARSVRRPRSSLIHDRYTVKRTQRQCICITLQNKKGPGEETGRKTANSPGSDEQRLRTTV